MITTNPESPSSDDSIEINFTVGYCYPLIPIQSKVGNTFELSFAEQELAPCVTAPPFKHTWPVGRLAPGDYEAVLKFAGETENLNFSVSQGQLALPKLPIPIPAMSSFGILILALTIAWVANKSFKPAGRACGTP